MVWALAAALALAGCVHLPPDVAAELTPPDGDRPNHFELRDPSLRPQVPEEAQG